MSNTNYYLLYDKNKANIEDDGFGNGVVHNPKIVFDLGADEEWVYAPSFTRVKEPIEGEKSEYLH